MIRDIAKATKQLFSGVRPGKTILIVGAPRSGTTWLSEIVATLPGYKLFDEPLHLEKFPESRDAGFAWRTTLAPDEVDGAKHDYLASIFSGQQTRGWKLNASTRAGRAVEHLSNSRAVVKTVRMTRMLHWVHASFDLRATVLIVRHPCAVVASMLSYKGAWDEDREPVFRRDFRNALGGSIPNVIWNQFPKIGPLRTPAELYAAIWCVDHYIPFFVYEERPQPWLLVSYEDLVTNGKCEVDRIFTYLDDPIPREAYGQLGIPSGSASDDLQADQAKRQLEKWKSKLSPAQIDAILRVVHKFGFDMYTDNPLSAVS